MQLSSLIFFGLLLAVSAFPSQLLGGGGACSDTLSVPLLLKNLLVNPLICSGEDLTSSTVNHTFAKPEPTDQRGPCPGLNALANRGYIPRNGIMTLCDCLRATVNVLKWDAAVSTAVCPAFFALTGNFPSDTISIGGPIPNGHLGLNHHGLIETDASNTRNDSYFGDNHTPDNNTINGFIAKGNQVGFNVDLCSQWRRTRYLYSKANNPEFVWTPQTLFFTSATCSFIISNFNETNKGNVTQSSLESWLLREEIPVGFCPRSIYAFEDLFLETVTTAFSNADIIFAWSNGTYGNISSNEPFNTAAPLTLEEFRCFFTRNAVQALPQYSTFIGRFILTLLQAYLPCSSMTWPTFIPVAIL